MAPGLRRAAVYTPLACALLAAGLLPPQEPEQRGVRPAPRTDIRAARQLSAATERLGMLTLRDSVLNALRSRDAASTDSLAFVIPATLPEKVGRALRGIVMPLWTREIDGAPRVRGVVVVEVDTAYVWQGFNSGRPWTRVSQVLPEATDGHTCVSRIAVGVRDARSIAELGRLRGDLLGRIRADGLGACRLYAAFGNPGAGVRAWLAQSAYLPAARSSRIFASWWEYGSMPEWLHFGYVECAAGNADRCREILWSRPGDDRRPVRFTEFDVPGVVMGAPYFDPRDPLGPSGPTYLADMLAHYGRDRFARFWASDAPLEQAFADAMGEPIERWTMQWAQAEIGVPNVGPRMRAMPALLSVLVSLAVVGAAGALSRLRQVA
jgi:hypothetical protein